MSSYPTKPYNPFIPKPLGSKPKPKYPTKPYNPFMQEGFGHGAAAGAAPEAPAAAAGPPVDPYLAAQQNAANTSVALGNAWDTYQQGQIGASYGNLDNPAADLASNPYSQAALLQEHYNNSQRGTLNSAGNQLYSGSYQNATEANLRNYNVSLDAAKKQKQAALDALTKGALDRYSQTGVTLDADTLASLLKGLGG